MNIKNLLGKLSIGRAGVSTGTGNIVRTGAPEDAFRSGVAEFIRKAQTEEQTQGVTQETSVPDSNVILKPRANQIASNPGHTVTLVSRYKYPCAKTKTLKSEEEGGDSESIETGGLGWKYAANKDWANEQAGLLHEYHIYQYKNPKTKEVLKLSVPIEEYFAQQSGAGVLPEEQDTRIDIEDDEAGMESTNAENEAGLNTTISGAEGFKLVFETTRYTSNPEINPEYQAYSTPEPPKLTPTNLRAYEVMPSAYRNFNLSDEAPESKVPTWTKTIEAPVEETPSAYGTSFRYRFKDDQSPIPTLNGEKYNLGNLLTDLAEDKKVRRDPGVIKKGDSGYDNSGLNIYEYMSQPRKVGKTVFTLWDALDPRNPVSKTAQKILQEKDIELNPQLEHFTLGSGTLVNLGGKDQGVMSEGNLLARALWHLGDKNKFTQLGEKTKFDGSIEAYKAVNPEKPEEMAALEPKRKQLWARKEASRKAAASAYFDLMSMKPKPSKKVIETSEEPEFATFRRLRQKARQDGQNYVDFLAMNMPNELRKFILSQPYVSHAPTGGTDSPGGRHEFEHAISTDEHINENLSNTTVANESLGGLQGLSLDDSKLHALKLAFERNANNAINNAGRALYGRDTLKVKAEDSTGRVYDIPVPRDGEWSEKADNALNFVENHWLKDKFLTQAPTDASGNSVDGGTSGQTAITQLFNELEPQFKAQGLPLDRRAVAFAYLKANGAVKPEPYKDRSAYSILTNPAHTTKSANPVVINLDDEDADSSQERTISLYLYEPSSETGKQIKDNALRLHPFTDHDHEIAEKLLSTGTVASMEDAEYMVWANWLVNTIRSEKASLREKADLKAALKEQQIKERGMGKPMRWQHPLTNRKFEVSDERNEITEFAGNLEEFVNELKSNAGATFEPNRKMVYIMTNENGQQEQIELPNSVPVELPAGATYPVQLSELQKFSNSRLGQYGLVRAGDSIYPVSALQLLKPNEKGYFMVGRSSVSPEMIKGKTPEELAEKNIVLSNNEYYYAPRASRINAKIVPLVAVGGEKIALPSSQLMQRGKTGQQLLLSYASQLNGVKLSGGEIHQYPSESENQFVSNMFTNLVAEGCPEDLAIDKAKSAFAKSKMNTVAIQALTGSANPNIQDAAKEWSGGMIDFLQDNADMRFIYALAKMATSDVFHPEQRPSTEELVNALKEKAASGQLTEDIAKRMVDEYNMLTGYAPQQLEYIKPKLREAFMENYDAGGTPGLPNNALFHMLMSNAQSKFNKDHKLDSEASLDMSSHGLVSILDKPRSSHEGHMLEKVLPQSSVTKLKSLLTRDERRVQDVNPRYLTGRRNVAKNWEVTPIIRLLAKHKDWVETEGIFPPEMLAEAKHLAESQMVSKMREELIPESSKVDDDAVLEHLDMAVALDMLLHRKIEEVDKKPHVDLWDIMLQEPGVKPNSKEMSIKRRLAELESNRKPTPEEFKEIKRLKSELATGVSVDVADDTQAIPLPADVADHIIDEPMINSLTELMSHHASKGRTGLLSKIHGAFAREAFNQGNQYQKEAHDAIEVTDDSGKTYEISTGYIPTEFENILTPQYSDEQWLSDSALSAIQGNTARTLGGIHEGTLLGQFRKDLNEDLLSGADIDREQRAKMMYMALYKMSMMYQEDLEANKKALKDMKFDNPKSEQMFIKDIERDTQVLGMLDSYKIFDHLSNMIRLGRQFKIVAEQLKSTDDNNNPLPELDIARTQKIENQAIDLANEYDKEAMHVWNFITRTIYMDKENLAKLQAAGLGMNIGKSDALNETRLMQEDRDEVARVVVNKINNNARWYDSPVMAVNGQNMVEAEIGEDNKVGQTKINEDVVRKLSDTHGKAGRVIDETVSANALAGFLARRAMTFVTEMGKLDSITGHRRDAQFEQGELRSKQDFTQRSDFAWFVRNWFERARISDDVLEEEERDGMSRVDRAILKLESYFAGPGSILWGKPDGQKMLMNKVSNTALSLSLLNKYANVAFNANKGKKLSIDELLEQSSKLIADYSDELKSAMGYDSATPEQKIQIDEAIQHAVEVHSGNPVAGNGAPTLKDLFVSNFSQAKSGASDDDELGDEANGATGDKDQEFRPYNARQLSLAKGLAKLQVANDGVISELIKQAPENMRFVDESGAELRFSKAKLAAYIAQDICKEITDSITGLSQSNAWTIVPLSPMQIELGLGNGAQVTPGVLGRYINQRLDDYEDLIQSQFVPQTMSELDTEAPTAPKELSEAIALAYSRIKAFVQNGLIGDGRTDKTKKAAEMMAAMHAQASSVQHTLEHEFRSRVNDTNISDEELDNGYIRPVLSKASPKDIQHAVAHGMKQWANGETVWPIVTTQLGKFGKFGKLYEAQQKSLPKEEQDAYILNQKYARIAAEELQGVTDKEEIKRIKDDIAQAKTQELNEIKYRFFKNYVEPAAESSEMVGDKRKNKGNQNKKSDKAQLGYGSDKVTDVQSHALRDEELASDIHSLISRQLGQNIQNLQASGSGKYSPSAYTSAVSATQRGHILDVKNANPEAYSQVDEPPLGNTGWTHRYFGALNLDPAHPLYKRVRGYALNRRRNRTGVEEPLAQPSVVDTTVQPVQPVQDAERNSQLAIAIDRLVRYAAKLDAKGKFAEADLVDSLIHKLEVMV